MRIGICDDEVMIAEQLETLIKECLNELGMQGQIRLFHSAEEVIKEEQELEVLFLDIEMPQMDGIQLGQRFVAKNIDCRIIMATSREDRFREAFRIQAYDFITKPFKKKDIKEVLQRVDETFLNQRTIEVYKERMKFKIYTKNIKYIKVVDSYVEVYEENAMYRKDVSLKQVESMLDSTSFFRINKSFIINLKWIDDYKNGVVSIDGIKLKISVRNKKEFERQYIEYDVHDK